MAQPDETAPEGTDPADDPADGRPRSVSLMITRQQREQLRQRGWTDDRIRFLTPEEAHRILAEGRP